LQWTLALTRRANPGKQSASCVIVFFNLEALDATKKHKVLRVFKISKVSVTGSTRQTGVIFG
jgi:hypothetical protein